MRRSNAEFRHHLFQVTADSVFQPHLEIFQNLTRDQGAWCSRLHESGSVDVVTFATEAWWWWWCWWWPRSSTTYILLTSGLATLQGKHGKHASLEKTLTALTVTLPSLDLNLTGRPRPHCTAEVEGSGCAERTNTLPNASFSPHRTLVAAQRTLGIAPRGGALATLCGTRTDSTSLDWA